MNKVIFVIDTSSYAGNFERDLCAYVTGVIGECEVGKEFSDLYSQETREEYSQFEDIIDMRPDDHGCHRPTSIYPTKGWLYDGEFGEVPEAEFDQQLANKKYRICTAKYYQEQLAFTEKMAGWTDKSKATELRRLSKEIARCLSDKTLCPRTNPYNSVAIYFNEMPSKKQIALMKARVAKFAETKRILNSWDKNFDLVIYGFRLVTETINSAEITI